MNDNVTLITVDTEGLMGIAAAAKALKGLDNVLASISEGVKDAFSVKGYQDYLQAVRRFGKELANELLVLQLSFGKMKVAIAQAVAPIMEVFVPYLNQAIAGVIHFAGTVRQFFGALIAGVTGNDALAESADNAAEAEKGLESAATSAGKAAKRSLMGFDEINRLNGASGGGSSGSSTGMDLGYAVDPISPEVQAVVDKILALLAPLMAIDLTPLQTALQSLWLSVSNLASVVGAALEWLWYEILTPFTAWMLEVLAPILTNAWAASLDLVSAALEPLMAGVQALWESLEPVVAYIGESVVTAIQAWQRAIESLTVVFQQKGPQITGILRNLGQMVTAVWGVVGPVLTTMRNHASAVFTEIGTVVNVVTAMVIDALYGLSQFLSGVFTGNWKKAWEGIKGYLKSIINGIIGLLNTMINRLVSALNSVIRAANRLSFTVPSWVPNIGGSRFGFNISTVSASSIPYLAQGAVLPANKPFLAMVGDQRHGTNVEAPLATIQEAVAVVMEDMAASNLAGQEAIVGVLRQILEAVLGIHIADSTIAQAVDRYRSKMTVVNGGFV